MIVQRYNADGPDGIGYRRHTNPSAASLLSAEQLAELGSLLDGPAPDGGLWTGPKIAKWMVDKLGRKMHVQRDWEVLQRLNYRSYVTRPQHTKADTAAQETFRFARRQICGLQYSLHRRDRATLQQVQAFAAIGTLDINWLSHPLFKGEAQMRECDNTIVGERRLAPHKTRYRHCSCTGEPKHRHLLLAAHFAHSHCQVGFANHESVARHCTTHNALAQPSAGVDHHLAAAAGHGVSGEDHRRHIGDHELLDQYGHRGVERQPLLAAIDRKSVVSGKSVDLGGRRIITKKKKIY